MDKNKPSPAPLDRLVGHDLHLHVKTEYFNQIKSGEKSYEYRLCNDYWFKRINMRDYDNLIIYNAYRPGPENKIIMKYKGYKIMTITHPHFGVHPVTVYGIICWMPNAPSSPGPVKDANHE